jgi:glycine oxidase
VKKRSKNTVIVVGSGIVGLTIALYLLQEGFSVDCYDQGIPGKGCSAASLGIIYPLSPLDYPPHFCQLSVKAAGRYRQYLSMVEEISNTKIPVTETGLLHIALSESEQEKLATACVKSGIKVETMDFQSIRQFEPNLNLEMQQGLLFPDAFHVYAERLLRSLSIAVKRLGGVIHPHSRINSILLEENTCVGININGNHIHGSHTVIAGGAWSLLIDRLPIEKEFLRPIRGQSIVILAPRNFISHLIYTSELDLVPRRNGEIWVGSTVEDVGFDQVSTLIGLNFLSKNLANVLLKPQDFRIKKLNAGLRPKTIDGLPMIGQHSAIKQLYISTGHYKNGIFLAPLTAEMLGNQILEKALLGELEPYSPDRFK